jgi:hypothetical protein
MNKSVKRISSLNDSKFSLRVKEMEALGFEYPSYDFSYPHTPIERWAEFEVDIKLREELALRISN